MRNPSLKFQNPILKFVRTGERAQSIMPLQLFQSWSIKMEY